MTEFEWLNISIADIILCVAIIVITVVLLAVLKKGRDAVILKMGDHSKRSVIKKINVINIIYKVIKYFAIVTCILVVLQIYGVNVSSVLRGIGIASILAAISVQDLFKDLVQGMRIITDDFFGVGDYIEYNGELCRVVGLSGRTTTLKEVETEDAINICNRNIVEVRRLSGKVLIKVPMAYSVDTEKVDRIFQKCTDDISKEKGITKCKFLGLHEYSDNKAVFILTFHCTPGEMLVKRRIAQRIILDNIYSEGLEMAVAQIDVINS